MLAVSLRFDAGGTELAVGLFNGSFGALVGVEFISDIVARRGSLSPRNCCCVGVSSMLSVGVCDSVSVSGALTLTVDDRCCLSDCRGSDLCNAVDCCSGVAVASVDVCVGCRSGDVELEVLSRSDVCISFVSFSAISFTSLH